jgi:hypothetical protein
MQVERYRIVLTGMTMPGHKTQEVIVKLSGLFKISEERIRPLLVGEPSIIRRDLTLEKAQHLCNKIERRGAECSLKKVVREESKLRIGSGDGIEQTGILEPDLNMESTQFTMIEDAPSSVKKKDPTRLKPGFFSKHDDNSEQKGISWPQVLMFTGGLLLLAAVIYWSL